MTRPSGKPIFLLPHDQGAAMVRKDLEAGGIPYRDATGRFFDFHSLRCELATLAEAAGVSSAKGTGTRRSLPREPIRLRMPPNWS
jgi:hypothetical protein